MAKKQRKTEIKRAPTKRQLSRWQRQKRIQRIILIAGSAFFAIILAFIGFGYYDDQVKPLNQPVIKVNDSVIDMEYYLDWLKIYLQGVEPAKVPLMADMILGTIVQNQLIIQRAPDLGITVTAEEINSELDKLNLPRERVYRDAYSAELLTNRLLADYFDPNVPETADQVNVQAMFLKTEDAAKEILGKLEEGNSFSSLAKEFSVEPTTKEKGGELGWLPQGMEYAALGNIGYSLLSDIAFSLEPGILSEPTYDKSVSTEGGFWLLEVLEKDKDRSSHVRGILLGSIQEANEIQARLNAGEDFSDVAEEVSQHSESKEYGGDLGWIQKGYGNDTLNKAAFELEPGILSEPIYDETVVTAGGYWLVKVIEKETDRQVDNELRESVKANALQEWIEEQKENSSIVQYITKEQKSWAVEQSIGNMESPL